MKNEWNEECSLNEVQTKLTDMKQYFWDRDVFVKTVESEMNIETLMDAVQSYGEFNQSYYFAWFQDEGEYYIVHKPSGMMVNWYKHLGRTNTCDQDYRTIDDLRWFFRLFNEDVKDWAENHGYKLDT